MGRFDAMRGPYATLLGGLVGLVLSLLQPAPTSAATAGHFRLMLGDDHPELSAVDQLARRHEYVILQSWRVDEMRRIKASDPRTKVFAYKNFGMMIPGYGPGGHSSTGVNADEAPDEWFLKDPYGNRITSSSWDYLFLGNVGDPEYQRRWADNVISDLKENGWDGVFMDDVNPSYQFHASLGNVAKYPDDASYQAAVRSMLAYLEPRLRGAGLLSVANVCCMHEPPFTDVGLDWLGLVDGIMMEHYMKWNAPAGEGYIPWAWDTFLRVGKEAEARGKLFWANTYSPPGDVQIIRLGYATALLSGQGRTYYHSGEGPRENWIDEFNYDLGEPLVDEYALDNGVHRRDFRRGMVLVNPTPWGQTVSFDGSYSGSGLSDATAATMPSMTGLVLLRKGVTREALASAVPGNTSVFSFSRPGKAISSSLPDGDQLADRRPRWRLRMP